MKMFESDYTPSDRAYNAFLRLAEHLVNMSTMLDECERIIQGKESFDSRDGIDDIVQQLRDNLDTLENFAKDASERWKPIEPQVSEAIGRLRIETPPDSPSWCLWILDKAWRAWNGMNANLLIRKDSQKLIEGMISYRPKLGEHSLPELNQRITKEFRAGGVFKPEQAGGPKLEKLYHLAYSGLEIMRAEFTSRLYIAEPDEGQDVPSLEAFKKQFRGAMESYRWTHGKLASITDEMRFILNDTEVSRSIFLTIAKQHQWKRFQPNGSSFIWESHEFIRRGYELFLRLDEQLHGEPENTEEMLRKVSDCQTVWREHGYAFDEIEDIRQSLNWELSTILGTPAPRSLSVSLESNAEKQPDPPKSNGVTLQTEKQGVAPPLPEGPEDPKHWRTANGELVDTGLSPKPYKLLTTVWFGRNRSADFETIGVEVFDDKNFADSSLTAAGTIQSQQKYVRKFLSYYGYSMTTKAELGKSYIEKTSVGSEISVERQ